MEMHKSSTASRDLHILSVVWPLCIYYLDLQTRLREREKEGRKFCQSLLCSISPLLGYGCNSRTDRCKFNSTRYGPLIVCDTTMNE